MSAPPAEQPAGTGAAVGPGAVGTFRRVAVVGTGLLGGSFALALRRAGLAASIVGHAPADGAQAAALGIVDVAEPSLQHAVAGADLVVLAAPVAVNAECIGRLGDVLAPDALITDLSSVKAPVVQAARQRLGAALARYVPSHPVAGGERSGPQAARADLFEHRSVVLSPLPESLPQAVQRIDALWQALGMRVVRLGVDEHDAAYALLSHWPHAVSFALAAALARADATQQLAGLGGPGLKDVLRIARSSPALWADILLANRTASLQAADAFDDELRRVRDALHDGDRAGLQAALAAGQDWLARLG